MDQQLCRKLIENSGKQELKKLSKDIRFDLPEKVLQFGTGGFLRGFADFLIDKANKSGHFNGRILTVKSTAGSTDLFDRQDCLYTLNIKDKDQDELILSAAISRVLSAVEQWDELLASMEHPEMQLVISNTTEAGLQFSNEELSSNQAPDSFPAKLTALLYHRYKTFKGSADSGLVILPCELVVDNGFVLRDMILKLAELNGFDTGFSDWISAHNSFCNTLVDRIVPGKPDEKVQQATFDRLGYRDDLLLECESYLLWAIEADGKAREALNFAAADPRVILADSIEPYREQKLRLLNGTHTFSVPLAFLAGLETVYQATQDSLVSQFIQQLMQDEIAPTLEGLCKEPKAYAREVFARFENPHIEHRLLNVMFQQSTKMTLRNAASIDRYFSLHQRAPEHMALGLAAFLCYMKQPVSSVKDDKAKEINALWKDHSPEELTRLVIDKLALCSDPGQAEILAGKVHDFLQQLLQQPARRVLEQFLKSKSATT